MSKNVEKLRKKEFKDFTSTFLVNSRPWIFVSKFKDMHFKTFKGLFKFCTSTEKNNYE